MSSHLQNHYGPAIFNGYVVAAFRYESSQSEPGWHVTSYPNSENSGAVSSVWVTGETFSQVVSSIMENGMMAAPEKAAILQAIGTWEKPASSSKHNERRERIQRIVSNEFPDCSVVFDEEAEPPFIRFKVLDPNGKRLSASSHIDPGDIDKISDERLRRHIRQLCGLATLDEMMG